MAAYNADAKRCYLLVVNYYDNNANLPTTSSGVFFGFANYTPEYLYSTIYYAREYFSKNWIENKTARENLAKEIAQIFGGKIESAGINKFLAWLSVAQKNVPAIYSYLAGGTLTPSQAAISAVSSSAEQNKTGLPTSTVSSVRSATEAVKKGALSFAETLKTNAYLLAFGLGVVGYFVLSSKIRRS